MNADTFGNPSRKLASAIAVGPHAPWLDRARIKPTNRILAALPPQVLEHLLPCLKPEFLPRGRVLCEADQSLRHVYFVERGLVSIGGRLRQPHHRGDGDRGP